MYNHDIEIIHHNYFLIPCNPALCTSTVSPSVYLHLPAVYFFLSLSPSVISACMPRHVLLDLFVICLVFHRSFIFFATCYCSLLFLPVFLSVLFFSLHRSFIRKTPLSVIMRVCVCVYMQINCLVTLLLFHYVSASSFTSQFLHIH